MFKILVSTFLAGLISYLLTAPTVKLARRFNLVSDRRKRKHPAHTHQGIIPRAGGLPLYLAVLVASLIILPINKIMMGVLLGGALIVALGILDDYRDISPYVRFVVNLIIALIVISFGLGIPYVSNPFGGVIRLDTIILKLNFFGEHKFLLMANLFAIFWLVALMNFVNWSKGVDGQLPGFVAIASFILGILAFRFTAHDITQEAVVLFAFIVGGSFLGFLPWNFYPQKIMPGYGGGALAGYLLAVLSILSWGKLGTLILVLSIPLTDAAYVILRRAKDFKSPFRGDAGHFHHRLLEIGWGKRRIAVFYWVISLIFGLAALFFYGIEKIFALLAVLIFLAMFILVINKIKKLNKS